MVHSPAVWDLKFPPIVQFFLWIVSQNKILTCDSLAKRKELDDLSCLFCTEEESVHHFFYCVVAEQLWVMVVESLHTQQIHNFISIGNRWLIVIKSC